MNQIELVAPAPVPARPVPPAAQGPAPASPSISFSPPQMLALYREGRHDALAGEMLRVLDHFQRVTYMSLSSEGRYFVNSFMKHFLFLFSQADFRPSDEHLNRFILLNPVICSLTAISSFATTDPWLHLLLEQQANMMKLLALYNPRCHTRLNARGLFDASAPISSAWYLSFISNYKSCLTTETGLSHLREHLAYEDERLDGASVFSADGYFGATYINHEGDAALKRGINRSMRRLAARMPAIVNRPHARRAAVFSALWFPAHSVYRCMHKFIARLAQDYELTLVQLGPPRAECDDSLFQGGVRQFHLAGGDLDNSAFRDNDWSLVFYPDIGMNNESILCSNLRIAPVQVCGYGHPVSTRGSEIDYWLGGLDVESLPDAERNYSERLVVIPGAGVVPNKPAYEPDGAAPPDDAVYVNCPWYGQKINHEILALLHRVVQRCAGRVVFRLFPGASALSNNFMGMREEIAAVVGVNSTIVYPNLIYADYMRAMEQSHFAIDSHPFGGYATVIDSFHLGKPMVAIEGRKFFNRSAAFLLRAVGLEELVAKDADEYVDIVVRMVEDVAWRETLARRLAATDLDTSVYQGAHADSFARAMRHLIENHERLRAQDSHEPIVVR